MPASSSSSSSSSSSRDLILLPPRPQMMRLLHNSLQAPPLLLSKLMPGRHPQLQPRALIPACSLTAGPSSRSLIKLGALYVARQAARGVLRLGHLMHKNKLALLGDCRGGWEPQWALP